MRFVTRAACAVLLTLGAYVSIGCGDDGTEPAKDNPSPAWRHQWSKRFGDASGQYARAVAADTSGNSIVTGYFYGTVDFGGGTLTSAGAYDIFLAKLAPTGAYIWSKRFGDASEQTVQGVAVDQAGNVYIAGYFEGAVDFGGGALTSAGLRDVFVAKFGPDGSHIWSKRFGDANYQAANALAVDSFGNVIITGVFMGTVDFGGGALTSAGSWDIFVAQLDSGGNHVWSKRFGDGNHQYAPAVAVDGSGNVLVAGYFVGAVDFGGGALPNAGPNADIFVAKFGSDGAHVWSKSFGDTYTQSASAVAVDPSDNVLVTGGFYMTVDFGGGTLTSAGYKDAFLAKLSPGGAHIWSKRFGDADFQDAQAVTTDVSGNAFVAGYFSGGINFGGGTLVSAGGEDIFLAKFGL